LERQLVPSYEKVSILLDSVDS